VDRETHVGIEPQVGAGICELFSYGLVRLGVTPILGTGGWHPIVAGFDERRHSRCVPVRRARRWRHIFERLGAYASELEILPSRRQRRRLRLKEDRLMGVKDPDVFMALVERSDELMARKMAVLEGLFAVIVEGEGYPPGKIELSEVELEDVRAIVLRAWCWAARTLASPRADAMGARPGRSMATAGTLKAGGQRARNLPQPPDVLATADPRGGA